MSFTNKVVIVTGSSSGIGAATAILFAKEGANVVVVGRNERKLAKVTEKIRAIGKEPLVINADVGKDADCKRIIQETIKKFTKIDILVNNAGIVRYAGLLEDNLLEAYDEIMNVDVRAIVTITKLASSHLIASKGNIVNVSSVASMSTMPAPGMLSYNMAKAALDQFTRTIALELAPFGVRVNSVNPGPVITDVMGEGASWDPVKSMTPLGRVSEAEEIADMIAFLAGDKAKGMTGSIVVHDNGCLLKRDMVTPK